MINITPKELSIQDLQSTLQHLIAPRPICFASTISKNGINNLAPFSFFNIFSTNPPIAIFSPARSGRTGKQKDTYNNVKEIPEVVINIVNYDMVHQMSLASSPFDDETDEFVKSGFTPIKSDLVKPMRVKESPAQIECLVKEVKELGEQGGAGNLIICEIIKIHISENVYNEGKLSPQKLDLISRLGGNWYCRANGNALFEVAKPITTLCIGVDSLPKIVFSNAFTGNEIGLLGSLEKKPNHTEIEEICNLYKENLNIDFAKQLLDNNKVFEALAILIYLNGD